MAASYPLAAEMRGRVGMIVPAWYPPETPPAQAEELLLTTLAGTATWLDPDDVLVVVDGSPVAAEAARKVRERLAAEWGAPFQLLEMGENGGKGAALAAGVHTLLDIQARPLEWVAARDADGDHLLDDLPHLYRTGEQVAGESPGRHVCVTGRRPNLHAPMGWLRAEYEWLLNEVLVEAVAFGLGREGRAWDTRYLVDRIPDIQSGYKLYRAPTAQAAMAALRSESFAHPELELQRTGMEVVPFVHLSLDGGLFAEVERKTYHGQPVTGYGSVHRPTFYGKKLAWGLRRCQVPPEAAALFIDGALSRRSLFSDPSGREELSELRRFVLDTLCQGPWPPAVPPEPRARNLL